MEWLSSPCPGLSRTGPDRGVWKVEGAEITLTPGLGRSRDKGSRGQRMAAIQTGYL